MTLLTPLQYKSIKFLASSNLAKKFYWTGGTLLSYHYLHHRKSLDLDFFSEHPFSFEEVNDWIDKLKKKAGFKKINYKKIFDRWEFLLENEEILRIEFVHYNHEKKTLRKRERLMGVYIDSLEDIAANKTLALFDRSEPKDLFDIYFLIRKARFTPNRLLKLVEEKFAVSFSDDLFWSEAFKSMPLLLQIQPLMIQKSQKEREQKLAEIEEYFRQESKKYLEAKITT